MIVRALYRYRGEILAAYPRVELLGAPGDPSAPVAALLVLWERWDYTRGTCPLCGSEALGVSFGGLLSTGAVSGCCLECATGVTRHVGGIGVIMSCIQACLDDTPYKLSPATRAPPAGTGASYGGWGWSLGPLPKGIRAVLEELGADLST